MPVSIGGAGATSVPPLSEHGTDEEDAAVDCASIGDASDGRGGCDAVMAAPRLDCAGAKGRAAAAEVGGSQTRSGLGCTDGSALGIADVEALGSVLGTAEEVVLPSAPDMLIGLVRPPNESASAAAAAFLPRRLRVLLRWLPTEGGSFATGVSTALPMA